MLQPGSFGAGAPGGSPTGALPKPTLRIAFGINVAFGRVGGRCRAHAAETVPGAIVAMRKPPITHSAELKIGSHPRIKNSLTTCVEFYTRNDRRLASSVGLLLLLIGVSLAIGRLHPIFSVATGLMIGIIGVAVPQWERVVRRKDTGKLN